MNLIDNVAEALDYVPNEKCIGIKVSYQVSFLMIQVKNYFDGIVKLGKKKIISRTGDTENYRIGLSSVEIIAKEYDGEMIVQYDKQQFNVIVKLLA